MSLLRLEPEEACETRSDGWPVLQQLAVADDQYAVTEFVDKAAHLGDRRRPAQAMRREIRPRDGAHAAVDEIHAMPPDDDGRRRGIMVQQQERRLQVRAGWQQVGGMEQPQTTWVRRFLVAAQHVGEGGQHSGGQRLYGCRIPACPSMRGGMGKCRLGHGVQGAQPVGHVAGLAAGAGGNGPGDGGHAGAGRPQH